MIGGSNSSAFKRKPKRRFVGRGMVIGGVSLAALMSTATAHAQTDEKLPPDVFGVQSSDMEEHEAIVVTGSQIRGIAATSSQSVTISAEDVLASGSSTAAEMLKRIPQVTTFGADESNRSTNQGGIANRTYGTSINLRGLGPASTLTLLNGHRVPTSGLEPRYVDVSIIPTVVIERMEIVPDGASAIYGADAVAGVANIITRRGFQGVQVSARGGMAKNYRDYQANILIGHKFARGEILAAYEYVGHSRLRGRDRSFFTADLRPFGGPDNRATLSVPGNISANDTTYALPGGNGIVDASLLVPGTVNRFDQYIGQDILPRQDRHSLFASGKYEIADGLTADFDAYWSDRAYDIWDPARSTSLSVPQTNAFFVSPVPGAESVNVRYNFLNDLGNPKVTGGSRSYGGHFGLSKDLFSDWRVNLEVTKGRDDGQYYSAAFIRNINLAAALADSNPATAFNPFGSGGISNPATVASLLAIGDTRTSFYLTQYSLKADGSLLRLPGGAVRFALGGEYRRERFTNVSVTNLNTPEIVPFAASTTRRSVKAVFGELAIPLFGPDNGFAGVRSLDLSLALRHENYTDFGNTTNPKIGVSWGVFDGLRLRGTFGRSFRAPTFADLNPQTTGAGIFPLNNIVDPASPTGRSSGISFSGGNPNVKPEEATTWTLGFDLRLPSLDGVHLSATYFSIKDRNLIASLHGSTRVLIEEALYSDYITRNPSPEQIQSLLSSGLLVGGLINTNEVDFILDGRSNNFGETRMNGIDFSADYEIDTSIGRLVAGVSGSYITKLINRVTSEAAFQNVRGKINWPSTFRVRGDLGWSNGPYYATIFVNFVKSYENNLVAPAERVSSYATFDLNFTIDNGERQDGLLAGMTIALTAQNLFDRQPPYVNNSAGFGWDPQVAGGIGRLVSLTLTRKF